MAQLDGQTPKREWSTYFLGKKSYTPKNRGRERDACTWKTRELKGGVGGAWGCQFGARRSPAEFSQHVQELDDDGLPRTFYQKQQFSKVAPCQT